MINCIIIEDQPPAQRILTKYISESNELILKEVFTDGIKAREYLKKEAIDVIFLDIHLPKISGIDFLKSMQSTPKVIITTAFSDYALESYEYNVVDYLLKPISPERFSQAIFKLETIKAEEKNILEKIVIKTGHELVQLKTSDILYIKSDSDYTEVTTHQRIYLSKDSLKQWLEKLDTTLFCRVHKSYLINIEHLLKISGNVIHLAHTTIPLGRAYKKNFVATYLK